MNESKLFVKAEARYKHDTHRLADRLHELVVKHAGDATINKVQGITRRRGGVAVVDATLAEGTAHTQLVRELNEAIQGTRNLVDRIDSYQLSVTRDGGFAALATGQFTPGWVREQVLADLAEAGR